MIKFGYFKKKSIKEYNPDWPKIPDHPFIGSFGSKMHYLI